MFFEVQLNFHLRLEVFPWKPNLDQESPLLDDLMGPSCANGTNKDRQQKVEKNLIWNHLIFLKTIKYHMEQNKSFAGLHCTGFIVKHYFYANYKAVHHNLLNGYQWVSYLTAPICKIPSVIVAFLEHHPNWNVTFSWTGTVACLVYT